MENLQHGTVVLNGRAYSFFCSLDRRHAQLLVDGSLFGYVTEADHDDYPEAPFFGTFDASVFVTTTLCGRTLEHLVRRMITLKETGTHNVEDQAGTEDGEDSGAG